jgi:hypothetical protein
LHDPHDVEWYERVSGVGQTVATDAIVPVLDVEAAWVFKLATKNEFGNF